MRNFSIHRITLFSAIDISYSALEYQIFVCYEFIVAINALRGEINLPLQKQTLPILNQRYEIVVTFQLFVDAVQFNCFLSLAMELVTVAKLI